MTTQQGPGIPLRDLQQARRATVTLGPALLADTLSKKIRTHWMAAMTEDIQALRARGVRDCTVVLSVRIVGGSG